MGYSVAHKFVGLSPQQLEKNTGHNLTSFLFEYLHLTRVGYQVCLNILAMTVPGNVGTNCLWIFRLASLASGIGWNCANCLIGLARGLGLARDGNTKTI